MQEVQQDPDAPPGSGLSERQAQLMYEAIMIRSVPRRLAERIETGGNQELA